MKKSAFTLIELSIVLVIIGLLTGGSFKILKVMRERAQITRAQDDVKTAKEAVIGYAQSSNKLPSTGVFITSLSPIKNNQNPLFYKYATDLNETDICSFKKTDLEVHLYKRDGTSEKLDQNITNVAFVVASEGANHNMQTASVPNSDDTKDIVKVHASYFKNIDDNKSLVNREENYDDIVDWVTLVQLKENLKCSQNGLQIINDHNLLDGIENQKYGSSEIYVDGGTPFPSGGAYKWCSEDKNSLSWLQVDCDGTQFDLVADCSSATFKQCDTYKIEGKSGKNPSPAGIYKIKVFVKDRADEPIDKVFTIKINTDLNSSSGPGSFVPPGLFKKGK